MERIPVYFMPGLAASSMIFENIRLPDDEFETILLEWEIPLPKESLVEYAKRIALKVTHPNPVLVGVSFGGILVQEMAEFVNARKVIILSSVKSNAEYPKRMKIAKFTKAYKLLPLSLVSKLKSLARLAPNKKLNERLKLYEKYLYTKDLRYIAWAIEQVVMWNRSEPDKTVVHIQGDSDEIFPTANMRDYIPVKGGTHIMIINKFRWLNENLPRIIKEEKNDLNLIS